MDVVTYIPEDNTPAAQARYEATIESLRGLQKGDWIELEMNQQQRKPRGRPDAKRAAAARCTDAGREALRLLAE